MTEPTIVIYKDGANLKAGVLPIAPDSTLIIENRVTTGNAAWNLKVGKHAPIQPKTNGNQLIYDLSTLNLLEGSIAFGFDSHPQSSRLGISKKSQSKTCKMNLHDSSSSKLKFILRCQVDLPEGKKINFTKENFADPGEPVYVTIGEKGGSFLKLTTESMRHDLGNMSCCLRFSLGIKTSAEVLGDDEVDIFIPPR